MNLIARLPEVAAYIYRRYIYRGYRILSNILLHKYIGLEVYEAWAVIQIGHSCMNLNCTNACSK